MVQSTDFAPLPRFISSVSFFFETVILMLMPVSTCLKRKEIGFASSVPFPTDGLQSMATVDVNY